MTTAMSNSGDTEIFQASLVGRFRCAPDGTILACNRTFASLLGFADTGAAIGDSWFRFLPGRHAGVSLVDRVATVGRLEGLDLRLVTANKPQCCVRLNLAAVRVDGTLTAFEGELLDTTELACLTEQANQAQRLAVIGRLTSGVAHDFNNLLSIITGYADLLLAETQGMEAVQQLLTEVGQAAERGARLTRQLLAFSRRQGSAPALHDPHQIIRDFEKMLLRVVGEDVHWSSQLCPAPVAVRVDPGQLEQVLLNLVVNARDALAPGGSIHLFTELRHVPLPMPAAHGSLPAGDYLLIGVRDNGAGMDDDVKAHLFDPFFTTKAPDRGTGLGLATSLTFVEEWGGTIAFDSTPGQGTTAHVYLPLAPEGRPTPVVAGNPNHILGGNETVLIVEDDPNVCDVVRRVLEKYGYHALAAGTGEKARAIAAAYPKPIQLLLLDVVLPDTNGPELAAQLCADRPGLQVLFMSGFSERAASRYGIPADLPNFLAKPFSVAQLTAKLRQTLGT